MGQVFSFKLSRFANKEVEMYSITECCTFRVNSARNDIYAKKERERGREENIRPSLI
jgi:hypothetical protein